MLVLLTSWIDKILTCENYIFMSFQISWKDFMHVRFGHFKSLLFFCLCHKHHFMLKCSLSWMNHSLSTILLVLLRKCFWLVPILFTDTGHTHTHTHFTFDFNTLVQKANFFWFSVFYFYFWKVKAVFGLLRVKHLLHFLSSTANWMMFWSCVFLKGFKQFLKTHFELSLEKQLNSD